MHKVLSIIVFISSLFATYSVGDIISNTDQQITFDICAGGNGTSSLSLDTYNGTIIWLNISASW